MTYDVDAVRDEVPDDLHPRSLQLDTVGTGLKQQPCAVQSCLGIPVGKVRQVADDVHVRRAAADGADVVLHVLDRDVAGAVKTDIHHADGVSDQDDLYPGPLQAAGDRRRIGRQHGDRPDAFQTMSDIASCLRGPSCMAVADDHRPRGLGRIVASLERQCLRASAFRTSRSAGRLSRYGRSRP